mgnify:CR=1 FL=1
MEGYKRMKTYKAEDTYLEEYDIYVKPYLSYSQIQNIVNETIKYSTWSERQEVQDYLMLIYSTNLSKEEIDNLNIEELSQTDMLENIRNHVCNWYKISEAICYEESVAKQLSVIINKLPDIVKKAIDNGSK